jgi:hypothetical protein
MATMTDENRPTLYPLRVAVVALLWAAVGGALVWLWVFWVGWSDFCWRALVAGAATCAGGWILDLGWKLLRPPEKGEREGRRREG